MKKLCIRFVIFIMIIGVAILPASIAMDPYNVFHPYNPRDNGIESNKGFIKTSYIIKNHDKFDSLLFGSSRAGFVDIGYLNEVSGEKFYDMASSECLVGEQTEELKVFIRHGFIPKTVIVLVDDISCFVSPDLHKDMLYRIPYPSGGIVDKAEFYLKYTDLITNIDSMKVIKDHNAKKAEGLAQGIDNSYDNSTHMSYIDRFYDTGTERLDKESHFDPNEEQYQKGYWVDYYSLRTDEALSEVRELKKLCDSEGIKLIVATNPLYSLTYQKGIENGYLEYVKGLAEETDFYCFSSFSDITEDYHYYYETSHFTPEVTRMMIDSIFGSGDTSLCEQGFGFYADSDNIDSLIDMLKEQAIQKGIVVYGE